MVINISTLRSIREGFWKSNLRLPGGQTGVTPLTEHPAFQHMLYTAMQHSVYPHAVP